LDLSQSEASVTARALAKLEEAKQQHEKHAAAIEQLALAKEEVEDGTWIDDPWLMSHLPSLRSC
jgi:hypothetical protein